MSIFGTIMAKIFHHDGGAAGSAVPSAGSASPQPSAGAAPENAARPTSPVSSGPTLGSPTSANTSQDAASQVAQNDNATSAAPSGGKQSVDVAQVLDGMAAKNGQTLDWKHSIVDMMKLLGLDSSLTARQELAKELNYSGDMHDSATMNVWLHKQVMQKLAANGGTVPDSLKV